MAPVEEPSGFSFIPNSNTPKNAIFTRYLFVVLSARFLAFQE